MCIVFVNLGIFTKSHQVVNLQLSARKKKKNITECWFMCYIIYVYKHFFAKTQNT